MQLMKGKHGDYQSQTVDDTIYMSPNHILSSK